MSEETVVTIDRNPVIVSGITKVFENQYIRLDTHIGYDSGKLIFRNCTIDAGVNEGDIVKKRDISVNASGRLEIDGCKIIHPGRRFLDVIPQAAIIKNTSFILTPYAEDVIVVRNEGTYGAEIEGCSFVEDAGNMPHPSEQKHLLKLGSISMSNCTFKNIVNTISAGAITNCSFTGCMSIKGSSISDSTFTDCGNVCTKEGDIRNCDFIHVEYVDSDNFDIDNCRFQKIQADAEDGKIAAIKAGNGKIAHCSFDDVELHNSCYLADSDYIEDCQFTNCHTDRDDSELFFKMDYAKAIDSMNLYELGRCIDKYVSQLIKSRKAGELDAFMERYDAISRNKPKDEAKHIAQLRELVKEIKAGNFRQRKVSGSFLSGTLSGVLGVLTGAGSIFVSETEHFKKRYEKERKEFEKKYNKK